MLQCKGLTRNFAAVRALRGVDFSIAAGRVRGLVGENGAGKSTLLKILAGTLAADSGQVRLTGTLGYCPQDPVLNDDLTVGQHLRYFAAARRLGSLARAGELMNLLGYEQYRGQVAGELSGGTRQKLNLTLALLHDPDVLLLDEPYQGFDWETYLRFWDLVGDLRTRRRTIVIITHLVFEQDRFDLLADLAGGHLTPREVSPGNDDHARR